LEEALGGLRKSELGLFREIPALVVACREYVDFGEY
jgi:hypothetical protein